MNDIARNSIVVTIWNAIGWGSGFLLFVSIAAIFGATWKTDAFLLALALPTLIINTTSNVTNSIYLPFLTDKRVNEPSTTGSFVGTTILFSLIFSITLAFSLAIASRWILQWTGPQLSQEALRLANEHTLLLLPLIALQVLSSILSASFYSSGKFGMPAASVTLRYTGSIVFILILRAKIGITSLPISFLLGSIVGVMPLLMRWKETGIEVVFKPRLPNELGRMLQSALPWIVGATALQLELVIIRFLAARLPEGSVTVVDYASRISIGFVELLTSGFFLVILASWSQVAARGGERELRGNLRNIVLLSLFIVLPLVSIMIYMREPIIKLVFQRGKFDADLTALTASVLLFFLIGIPIDVMGRTYVRQLLVRKNLSTLGIAATLRVFAIVIFSLAFMRLFGVQGLALASTGGLIFFVLVIVIHVHKRYIGEDGRYLTYILKQLLCIIPLWISASLIDKVLINETDWLRLSLISLAGTGIYLLMAKFLRIEQLNLVLHPLLRTFQEFRSSRRTK